MVCLGGVKNNEEKHTYVIAIGLAAAVLLAIMLIGKENLNNFFQQFSTNIAASGSLVIALLTLTCILAVLFIIAGLLELNEAKEKFKQYIPEPPQGAWILNILLCILVTLLMYTSVTNILQYCVIYTVLIFVDFYFRYSLSNSANSSIQIALKDISIKRAGSENINLEYEVKYKMLLELSMYYKGYPILAVSIVRLLFSVSSIALIIIGKHTNDTTFSNVAYINMIYCLIINEIFCWSYRIKMVIALRKNN